MMNKKETSLFGSIKYVLFIPLIAGLLLFNCTNATNSRKESKEEQTAQSAVSNDDELPDGEKVYDMAEVMPEFPGGQQALMDFIAKNIKYPVEAIEKSIQGRVLVGFVVKTDGLIDGVKVVQPVDASLDKEAMRVINSMPKWTPGTNKGKAVAVKFSVPISFRLASGEIASEETQRTVAEKLPDGENVYTLVEEMPEFPGGQQAMMSFIAKNIMYPVEAQENGIQGKVTLCFVVKTDGSLDKFEVVKSVGASLDKEALRVVRSMPKWIPGKEKGKVVAVKYTVPITFRLLQ
ncbi:MAG: energy transducer TonB [Tannerella sp.]|jgi:TonB family protein|nr:energy transducer TonB [Tannerella sp.]